MISIPRSLARDLRALGRKLVPAKPVFPPVVELAAGPDGLAVRVATDEVAVLHRVPGRLADCRVVVPLDAVPECSSKDDAPVTFEPTSPTAVRVSWVTSGVPQTREVDGPDPARVPAAPIRPASVVPFARSILEALDAANQTAAKDMLVRFALTRVQLRGRTGEVVATDSHQVLIQGGFAFPWAEDLLVPRTGVFAALAALDDGPVAVGRTVSHVWVTVGAWAVALVIDGHGKFPDVSGAIPRAAAGGTTLVLDPADRAALVATLPALPGKGDDNRPVTLDLNGKAVIRARPAGGDRTAELLLARSTVEGDPVRVACDRQHLLRAAKLGFGRVQVADAGKPLASRDGHRTYAWMPLDAGVVVGPTADAVPVTPPAAAPASRLKPNRTRGMDATSAQEKVGPHPAPTGGLIEEAVAVRDALRDLLGRVRGLVDAARRQRQQHRLVKSTLASLKQLQHTAG